MRPALRTPQFCLNDLNTEKKIIKKHSTFIHKEDKLLPRTSIKKTHLRFFDNKEKRERAREY